MVGLTCSHLYKNGSASILLAHSLRGSGLTFPILPGDDDE